MRLTEADLVAAKLVIKRARARGCRFEVHTGPEPDQLRIMVHFPPSMPEAEKDLLEDAIISNHAVPACIHEEARLGPAL